MEGGWPALILGIFLFIVGSLSLGFLISTVARNQLQAMQMSFFYMLPSILLSGFLFPFKGMPLWAQWIGTAIPVTHMLRVVRGAMLKGVGIADAAAEPRRAGAVRAGRRRPRGAAIPDDAGLMRTSARPRPVRRPPARRPDP